MTLMTVKFLLSFSLSFGVSISVLAKNLTESTGIRSIGKKWDWSTSITYATVQSDLYVIDRPICVTKLQASPSRLYI